MALLEPHQVAEKLSARYGEKLQKGKARRISFNRLRRISERDRLKASFMRDLRVTCLDDHGMIFGIGKHFVVIAMDSRSD